MNTKKFLKGTSREKEVWNVHGQPSKMPQQEETSKISFFHFCEAVLCSTRLCRHMTQTQDEDQAHFAVQMLKLKTMILILFSSLMLPVYKLA